jgi:hypothetical protein
MFIDRHRGLATDARLYDLNLVTGLEEKTGLLFD